MNLFQDVKVIKDQSGKRRYETTLIPRPILSESDLFIITTSVDRLDLISNRIYGTPIYWRYLAKINGLGKGTYSVPRNTRLRIPQNVTNLLEEIKNYNGSR